MTTTITIAAHCTPDKEVSVRILDHTNGTVVETFAMQDGDTTNRVVFDGRELTVSEVLKAK